MINFSYSAQLNYIQFIIGYNTSNKFPTIQSKGKVCHEAVFIRYEWVKLNAQYHHAKSDLYNIHSV